MLELTVCLTHEAKELNTTFNKYLNIVQDYKDIEHNSYTSIHNHLCNLVQLKTVFYQLAPTLSLPSLPPPPPPPSPSTLDTVPPQG